MWNGNDLAVSPVTKYWRVTPADGATAIVGYDDGRPAILERTFGEGRTGRSMLLTTAGHYDAENPWTELPLGWSYIVLAHEITNHLAGAGENRLDFSAGTHATIPLDPSDPYVRFTVTDPNGRVESLTIDRLETRLIVPSVSEVGNHQVSAVEEGKTLEAGFSVNLEVDESLLVKVDEEAIKSLLGEERISVARDPNEFERIVGEARVGREIFPWLMLLVTIALCGETYLANRFYKAPAVEHRNG